MKQMIITAVFAVVITACEAAAAPGSMVCTPAGVCIKIQVTGRVRINEPITVITTVIPNKDYPHVSVALSTDGPVLMEDNNTWRKGTQGQWIDLRANRPVSISHRILVTNEGQFYITASATAVFHVEDWAYIIITKDGGKVYLRGEPIPTQTRRPLPPLPTVDFSKIQTAPPPTIAPNRDVVPITPTRQPYP